MTFPLMMSVNFWPDLFWDFPTGTKTEQNFCQWKQTCARRKQKRMSPTSPTTIWSHLKQTSWNEHLWMDISPSAELNYATLQIAAPVQCCCSWMKQFPELVNFGRMPQHHHIIPFMGHHQCASFGFLTLYHMCYRSDGFS